MFWAPPRTRQSVSVLCKYVYFLCIKCLSKNIFMNHMMMYLPASSLYKRFCNINDEIYTSVADPNFFSSQYLKFWIFEEGSTYFRPLFLSSFTSKLFSKPNVLSIIVIFLELKIQFQRLLCDRDFTHWLLFLMPHVVFEHLILVRAARVVLDYPTNAASTEIKWE